MDSLSALAIRTRSGDAQARIEFFDRLRPYVRALAGQPDCLPAGAYGRIDPSEITQSALVRVINSLADFQGTSDQEFCAWIRTIVRNLAIDILRGLKPVAPIDVVEGHAAANGHPVADDSSPSEKLLRAERILLVNEALKRLPEDQQNAVRWRYFDKLSIDEIAERLGGRSYDAAAQLVHRGMDRLRELLARHE